MMTPEEFKQKMQSIKDKYPGSSDIDVRHEDMDKLMCNVLEEHGYGEGIEIFVKTDKYYA